MNDLSMPDKPTKATNTTKKENLVIGDVEMPRLAIQLLLGPENDAIEVGGSSRETGLPSLRAAGTVYT